MAGILDTLKLAGVLVLAIPAALAGLEMLAVRGQPLTGGVLLALSAALVVGQRWLTTPGDLPGLLAGRLFGSSDDSNAESADERP